MAPAAILASAAAGITVSAVAWGAVSLCAPPSSGRVRVAVLQGNISQETKWDPDHRARILRTYAALTAAAAADRPDLIVWPEAATPGRVLKDGRVSQAIAGIVRSGGAPAVVGSAETPKHLGREAENGRWGNAALYFSDQGRIHGQYLKNRLVPFAEWVPYRDQISWPGFIVPANRQGVPVAGSGPVLFMLDGVPFGVLICWETLFPDLARHLAANGAGFLVNISNEAPCGLTPASRQILAANVFRVVENRISVARAANSGISCFIDSTGTVSGKVTEKGREIFVEGHSTREMIVSRRPSFYSRHGDVFTAGCAAAGLVLLAWALVAPAAAGRDGYFLPKTSG